MDWTGLYLNYSLVLFLVRLCELLKVMILKRRLCRDKYACHMLPQMQKNIIFRDENCHCTKIVINVSWVVYKCTQSFYPCQPTNSKSNEIPIVGT